MESSLTYYVALVILCARASNSNHAFMTRTIRATFEAHTEYRLVSLVQCLNLALISVLYIRQKQTM